MDFFKLFKDAFFYPTNEWGKLLLLGFLNILVGIASIYKGYQTGTLLGGSSATITNLSWQPDFIFLNNCNLS